MMYFGNEVGSGVPLSIVQQTCILQEYQTIDDHAKDGGPEVV